ncbi:hypothetical protein CTA2_10169 [Colletotrichum tanaceti]|uniref:BZIP domain-containing protein n=1 Tax=Colletotrichum tanaceti TaxID=1306861 RepID=A0A4U6XG49_9PEZI|nr:hypothetical protein CTA2_10169 [Colletotrichum tanaceti]TKW54858.1 hypothetical protein CTA1_4 [Colletotrichum tanaceti]
MSGPYPNQFPFSSDNNGYQTPYIYEQAYNQNVSPYMYDEYHQPPHVPQPVAQQPQYHHHHHQPGYSQAQPYTVPDDNDDGGGDDGYNGQRSSKRLRSGYRYRNRRTSSIPTAAAGAPWDPNRSTTPDFEPPLQARIFSPRSIPGGYSATLTASLSIPDPVDDEERLRRQREIRHILQSTTSTALPAPSPRVKSPRPSSVSAPSPTAVYRIRARPKAIQVGPMLSPRYLGAFTRVDDVPAGPQREAAVEHNNRLAAARLAELKRRNNAAASRSRNRRDRAVVGRTEALSAAKAQMHWWKARAVSLGAAAGEWDALPETAVREALVADYRVDALDYSRDDPGGGEALVEAKTAKKAGVAKRKRKAPSTE